MTEDSDLFQNWYRSGAKKTLARPSKQDLGTSRSLLEVLFRISDDDPRRFFGGLLPGSAPSLVLSTVNVSNFKLVSYSHSRSFNAYTYFQIFCKGLACFRLSRDSVRKQLVFGQPSIKISAHFSAANEFCRSRSEQHTSGEKHTRIAVWISNGPIPQTRFRSPIEQFIHSPSPSTRLFLAKDPGDEACLGHNKMAACRNLNWVLICFDFLQLNNFAGEIWSILYKYGKFLQWIA